MTRTRGRIIAAVVLLAICGIAAWIGIDRRVAGSVVIEERAVPGAGGVTLESRLLVPRSATPDAPAPAVLLAHGLGDEQNALRALARTLVRAGFVVRTWQSRGTGASTGQVGIASPDGEVADVSALIDELGRRDDVQQDADGDPRVAIVGVSHGGAVGLLAGAADHRIDAVVPIYAWWDLAEALEPNGVLKLRWASELFAAGSGEQRRADPCGNLAREVCEAWIESAQAGRLTAAARRLLVERSPRSVADRLRAPTLIVHGQMDSLFGMDQALGLAQALADARVPVRVEWLRAGHDLALAPDRREHVDDAVLRWLELHLRRRGGVDAGPPFTVELGSGRGYAHAPEIPPAVAPRAVELTPDDPDDVARSGTSRIELAVPAAGLPADATTLPGLGDVTALNTGFVPPAGQRARFRSEPMPAGVELVGAPRITLSVASSTPEALLFVRLVDIAPDGRRIVPRGLVTPLRLTGLPPLRSAGTPVRVRLPHLAWRIAPGHRMGIEVSSTDAGYVAPHSPGIVSVAPASGTGGLLTLPRVDDPEQDGTTFDAGISWRTFISLAVGVVLLACGIGLLLAMRIRRRDHCIQEPLLREVPIVVRGLTKRYGRGRSARLVVDGVDLRVEAGNVVGLVGPNGAGKSTIIRMLLGLVHPDDGFVHAFGQRVRPGAPHLARIGALIEEPGLLPHVSGRAHLQRAWGATGRPREDAGVEEALAAVDLTADADRIVRTWSQGMRQRLGIAQALLGAPDVVLLDEPTNGLDPAQIIELRRLVRRLADEGRTVVLSSHLLGELEQVCTHVVLLAEGRVLTSGTLEQVRGTHPDLETAFLARLMEQRNGAHDA